MHRYLLLILLTSCSFKLGKIPIVLDKFEEEELNYKELIKTKNKLAKEQIKKDCIHIYFLFPDKLEVEFDNVISRTCSPSKISFDNKISYEFFYFIYGKECLVNEYRCENN